MNIWKISLENIKSKPLYTCLSVFVLGISIALLLGIKELENSFQHQIEHNIGDVDLVIGAKGSPLQLVLASVLHIDNPTGNINYKEAKKIGKSRFIKSAVPISYGDNYKGYKIIGTTEEFASLYDVTLIQGRAVKKSMEVVVGATVAKQLNLRIGDAFLSSHGLVENDVHVHEEKLTVVGIYKSSGKVIDRLIVTNLKSVWDVHDEDGHGHGHEEEESNHDDHHHVEEHEHGEELDHNSHEHKEESSHGNHHHDDEHEHAEELDHNGHEHKEISNHDDHHHGEEDEHAEELDHNGHEHHDDHDAKHEHKEHIEDIDDDKEITSLLLSFRSPSALLTLPRKINKETNMQAVLPKYELKKLYKYTSIGMVTISWIAYIVLVISSIIIFISLYKMVKEHAFDLALLRTYGASNFQLIKMVAYEGMILGLLSFIFGLILSKTGLYFVFKAIAKEYNQEIFHGLSFIENLQIAMLMFLMIIISILLAIYPIIKMNISTILNNEK